MILLKSSVWSSFYHFAPVSLSLSQIKSGGLTLTAVGREAKFTFSSVMMQIFSLNANFVGRTVVLTQALLSNRVSSSPTRSPEFKVKSTCVSVKLWTVSRCHDLSVLWSVWETDCVNVQLALSYFSHECEMKTNEERFPHTVYLWVKQFSTNTLKQQQHPLAEPLLRVFTRNLRLIASGRTFYVNLWQIWGALRGWNTMSFVNDRKSGQGGESFQNFLTEKITRSGCFSLFFCCFVFSQRNPSCPSFCLLTSQRSTISEA